MQNDLLSSQGSQGNFEKLDRIIGSGYHQTLLNSVLEPLPIGFPKSASTAHGRLQI